ncbi:hypothetical protein Q9L58_009404 [Maublancomyces gigas]|uniref:F-box domain-containing protein n=1 Tax=Discina gigas TaxID=1032678 RepID=A0ABR3G722_9PEZI
MSVLEQLPLEISTEILSYLPFADLLKISKLSRHMHAVSKPLLFKTLILTSGDGKSQSSLQILLEVLLSPGADSLAKYVRTLHVKWDSQYKSETDISLLTEAASRLGLHLPLTWEDGQLVLLLHLLPRLHDVELSPPGEGDDRVLDLIAAQTPMIPGTPISLGLRHLRRFRCTPNSSYNGVNPRTLLTLLQMPSIREIDVRIIDGGTLAPPDFDAAASTSGITHLRLSGTNVPAESLTHILAVPAALAHFTYFAQGTAFNVAEFGSSLLPLKHALQVLHLDIYGLSRPWNTPSDGAIGSLRDWPALHVVRGSMMAFLGRRQTAVTAVLSDVLPAGITEFEILRDRYWSVAEEMDLIVQLVAQKAVRVPVLQVIRADLGGRGALRSLASLTAHCKEAGVVLVDNSTYRETLRVRKAWRRARTRHSCCRRSG